MSYIIRKDYFCRMLSQENESFLQWWAENRIREKNSLRPFLIGLSFGFSIGIGVILVLESGWYERANMVANSRLSSVVFVLALMIISVFMAFVYRKFRWEMQEQRYQELLILKNKSENKLPKQP